MKGERDLKPQSEISGRVLKPARILVFGSQGTIGVPLVEELRARGHQVRTADVGLHSEQDYLKCNIQSHREVIDTIFRLAPSIVYNLAAEFGRANGEAHYEAVWSTNVTGLKHILNCQRRFGFKLIHFSSSEIYGDFDGVMTEDVPDHYPLRQMNDYALSKWVNEQQIMNSGGDTVRVRLFNTYGPGEYYSPYRSAVAIFAYHALMNKPYTVYSGHTRTWTYISDMVRTLANIPDHFKSGEVYNIAGHEQHDMKHISDLILNYTGRDDRLVTYAEREPNTTRHKLVSTEKAHKDLGHDPQVSLEDGLQRTVGWMRGEYKSAALSMSMLKGLGELKGD